MFRLKVLRAREHLHLPGPSLTASWPSGDGSRMYVGLENADEVAVIDTASNKVIANVAIGQGPQGVAALVNRVPQGYLLISPNNAENCLPFSTGHSSNRSYRHLIRIKAPSRDLTDAMSRGIASGGGYFLTSLRGWVQRQKDLRALDALGTEGRRDIAQDLNLSESTLCGLASRGPGASAELPKMLQALSFDPAELSLTHPAVLRDMAVVCSECDEKSRCRSDLTLRIAAAKYDEYCPNAQTIEALQEQEMQI